MPELPEVETMRRGVLPIVGGRIVDVVREKCRLKAIEVRPELATFRRRVKGQSIRGVGRVGKRVVLELESGERIIFEPRMAGLVLLADPPDREHCRLRIDLEGVKPRTLLYWDRRGLGSVRLLSPAQFAAQLGEEKLGPDALTIPAGVLHERLGHSARAIKVALLDQRALAGVGNVYASEALHVAGIHPARPCRRLRRSDWQKLAAAIHEVLEEALSHEGSTLSDGTYRNAQNEAGSYQNHHRVYDRAGQRCRRCRRGKIRRIVQAQRSTYFCPVCQRT